MPRPKKSVETKTPQEIRKEVRDYIKNERDTILKKWMALEEAIASEDSRKEQFLDRQLKIKTRSIPLNIRKFIGTLKKSVRHTMRYTGGTPFSIIRNMFLYWDADKSGEISESELKLCMNSLGVKMSKQERDEVIEYYGGGKACAEGEVPEMNYDELLKDIQHGEPTVIAYVSEKDEEQDAIEERYEEITDDLHEMPEEVQRFIEASREYIQTKMRNEGGTPFEHIRNVFQKSDFTYSNALDAPGLVYAAQHTMKLVMTKENADIIIKYYDRKKTGRMDYREFLADVCKGVKSILTFTDLSPREISNCKKSLSKNKFIPKPFKALPNKTLEKFKRDIKAVLLVKLSAVGGTMSSWLKGAFLSWDNKGTGKVLSTEGVRAVCKHLGLDISEHDAASLIHSYDRDGDGGLVYSELIKDISTEDPHFMVDSQLLKEEISKSATSRTPSRALHTIKKFTSAVDLYVNKSKGGLQPRDILHGTFLRFDTNHTGYVDGNDFINVAKTLNITVSPQEVNDMTVWFDTGALRKIDYNEFTRQVFGDDIQTRALTLPRLTKKAIAIMTSKAANTVKSAGASTLLASLNYARPISCPIDAQGSLSSSSSSSSLSSSNQDGSMHRPKSTSNHSFADSNILGLSSEFQPVWQSQLKHSMVEGLTPKEKNTLIAESKAVKEAKRMAKRELILHERDVVQAKLNSIEQQRKAILDDYKARHQR